LTSIKEILQQREIDTLEAEIILAWILQVTRVYLHAHCDRKLSPQEKEKFFLYKAQRQQGKPIAYITGEKEFWSLNIKVTPDTLIPRAETELLVETVLEKFCEDRKYRFLELATGSGAISIVLGKNRPNAAITASDISIKALDVAKENQCAHQLENIDFISSDWFVSILKKEKFDAIISNPPYISQHDPHLRQGDVRFEPVIALTPGKTGLEAIAHIISEARHYLSGSGWLFLEHGYDQAEQTVQLLLKNGYYHITTKKDLNNLSRVTFGCISDV
jgi:release factor glutamine methyltransferase